MRIGELAGTKRYRINPTEAVLAVTASAAGPEARMLRWGLLPAYATTTKTRYPYINATVEALSAKGSYFGVSPDPAHRALILADGFYEWPRPESTAAKAKLRPPPMRFVIDGGAPFAFAGLWTTASHLDDGSVASCTIITCDASKNRVLAPIHNRIPAILPDVELMRAWLHPRLSAEDALGLCVPVASERISATLASRAVNNVKLPEGPELLTPDD